MRVPSASAYRRQAGIERSSGLAVYRCSRVNPLSLYVLNAR